MSGGGGGGSEGAPDFYYRHLVEAGQSEQQMAEDLMNFYEHGSFEGPRASQDDIDQAAEDLVGETGGGYTTESTRLPNAPGPSGSWPTRRVEQPTKYTVAGSDEEYESRDEALRAAREMVGQNPEQYGLQTQERYSGPSYADVERQKIQSNYDLIPRQTALQEDQIRAQERLIPRQTALQEDQIRAQQRLIPRQTALQEDQIRAQQRLTPLQSALQEDQIRAQQRLTPLQSALQEDQIRAQQDQIRAQQRLTPQQANVREAQMQSVLEPSIWEGGGSGGGASGGGGSGGGGQTIDPRTSGSNRDIVRHHYQELFGRDPDSEGMEYWTGELESGADRGELEERMLSGAADKDKTRYEQRKRGTGGGRENQFTHQARLQRDEMEQARRTLPVQGEAERAQLRQTRKTAPIAGKTERMGLREQQQVMRQRAPVLREYFQEAQNVDPDAWANRAQAETAQQFGQERDQVTRNITRTGATPGSSRTSALMGDLATQQAKATSAARNIARRRGEKEKFSRLSQVVGGAGSIGG